MISGLEINGETKAYSFQKIKEMGILNEEFGDLKLLIIIDPNIEVTEFETNPIRVFNRELDGDVLEFEIKDQKLIEKQTQSEWNFNGEAIGDQYFNKKLIPLSATSAMWFSWLSAHPNTNLYY